jgi:uncharacterized membrane protein
MELYYAAVNLLRMSALLLGSLVIFIGIMRAAPRVFRAGSGRLVARRMLPQAALGLEFFIGATVLSFIHNPTWTAVFTTALTIVTRKLIMVSFDRLAQDDQGVSEIGLTSASFSIAHIECLQPHGATEREFNLAGKG